jgi:hypothetical protein
VIAYLSEIITWRRSVGDLSVYVTNPDETLFAADARQMADEVLKLAFDFARAAALVLQDRIRNGMDNNQPEIAPLSEKTPEAETTIGVPVIDPLRARRDQVQTTLVQLNAQQKDLQNKLSRAAAKNRTTMSGEIVAIQAQIELAQSRLESLNAMIDFESSTAQKSGSPTALKPKLTSSNVLFRRLRRRTCPLRDQLIPLTPLPLPESWDGLSYCSALRAKHKRSVQPLIILTNWSDRPQNCVAI